MGGFKFGWPRARGAAPAAPSRDGETAAAEPGAAIAPGAPAEPDAAVAPEATPDRAPRWVAGPGTCTDLVDAAGRVRGYVGPTARGTRGYVVQTGPSEWPPRPAAFADHPTEAAARAWVEARVAGGRAR